MKSKQLFLAGLTIVAMVVAVTAVIISPRAYAAPTAAITITTNKDVVDGNDGECSLREAIIAANTNSASGAAAGECPAGSDGNTDIITLANGATYNLEIAGANEDAALTGDLDIVDNAAAVDVQFVVADGGNAVIDAEGIDRALHVLTAVAELTNIDLTNGLPPANNGGNLYNDNGMVTFTGGTISRGRAGSGGGIYSLSSTPTGGRIVLNGTLVTLNTADNGGGGILSSGSDSLLTLNDASIRANTSTLGFGGGIYVAEGTVAMTDGSVNLNQAPEGGGIYAETAATLTIDNGLIEANQATSDDGGGIYLADADTQDNLTLQNSTIKDNTAVGTGGGLYGVFQPLTGRIQIQNNEFSGNQAASSGAIFMTRAHISSGVFDNNSATSGSSGAIFINRLVITDTVFTNNSAADNAGGMFVQNLVATNIRVENNQATNAGGGIYMQSSSQKDIVNSTISNNTAASGAGIYMFSNNGLTTISKTAITNNQATNEGGGIWASDTQVVVSNSTISSNSANTSGGGLYIDTTAAITATNVTIALNTPGQDLYKLGDLTLQNSIIYTPATPNCTVGLSNPTIISLGNNLSDDNSCPGLNQSGDEINVDVGLAPLANYGGNSLTHDLLDGSPAIDSGNDAACTAAPVSNVDQRGILRPIGVACDKGAVERGSLLFLPTILK